MKPAIALLLLLVLALDLADANASGADYTVTIDADKPHVASVTARFTPMDDRLFMFPGAQQLERRWATFVSDLQVSASDGSEIGAQETPGGSWVLEAVPEDEVTVSYRVTLDHEDHHWSSGIDGAAYARNWGVFYTGRSLFIANGEDRNGITVSFELPAGWQVTTPWQALNDTDPQFAIADHTELGESMLFAGQHRSLVVDEGDFELRLALGGENVTANERAYVDTATGVLDYYVELMGGIPRLRSADGVSRSVVIISEDENVDGEVIGNNISMLLNPEGDPMMQVMGQLIFAHEFFHLWNGKSIVPASEDTEWFKEGFSNYYTLKALLRVGALDESTFLDVLSGFFYQRYRGDSGVGTLSMSDGSLKHDHWGLVYAGGLFAAICQDLLIRDATNNERSIDQMMRSMFVDFADDNYTLDDIKHRLGALAGSSQEQFFARHITGVEELPIAEHLALAGIDVVTNEGQTGFRVSETSTLEQDAIRRAMFGTDQ